MKTNMRNTLLTGLLLFATGSLVTAQQYAVAPVPPVPSVQSVPPVATVSGYGQQSYSYSVDNRTIRDEDLKSKEISKEIAAPKNGDIYVENTSRNIIIKTWDQQKVKVTTTVYYE